MSEIEKWMPVPGTKGYEVSDLGRIMSFHGAEPQELVGYLQNGYRRIRVLINGARKSVAIHRLVALAFYGPCPEGLEVRHLDGNRLNNQLSNLSYGTHTENMQDAIEHGTHSQASKSSCVNGHEFTPENTFAHKGARHCRECRRQRNREWRQRRAFAAANVSERAA